jgi:hypothetical protein
MSIPFAFGVQYGIATEIRLPYAGLTELELVAKILQFQYISKQKNKESISFWSDGCSSIG